MERRAAPCRSAPYGQACLHCFKAKCRCIGRADDQGCERCHRLNKQCLPSDSVRTRNGQQSKDSAARIAQLEGKLDTVVSLLSSLANSNDTSAALRRLLDTQGVASQGQFPLTGAAAVTPTSLSSSTSPSAGCSTDASSIPLTFPSCSPAAAPAHAPHAATTNAYLAASAPQPSAAEAERYLANFQSHMLPNLPLVHLARDVTAEQLRLERPFFFRAIVAVSATSIRDKVERGKELKRVLAQETLVENQSSLDLLLGLLTYVAWGSDQFLTKTETLSRLMMMAMSLVYDLGLNKPPPPDEHMIGPFVPEFQCPIRVTTQETGLRLLERQRASLGCFLLSSIISSYFGQIDAMRWTPQMEEHLRAIAANNDCPTDETLAYQVRLQLLAQETVRARDQLSGNHDQGAAASPSTFLFLNAVQLQLRDLESSIRKNLPSQEILMLHVHYIELCISETGHTANSKAPVLPSASTSTSNSSNRVPNFERLEYLWRSVNAIKSWLDIFLTLQPVTWRGLSFLFWGQLARCLVTLIRLSTLEDPSWDRQAVRSAVDLRRVLDLAAEKMDSEDELFAQFPRSARILRAWVSAKMAPEEPEEQANWADFADESMGLDSMMPWITDAMDDWASF